jgi:predicted MFS family arabinose efflux permease
MSVRRHLGACHDPSQHNAKARHEKWRALAGIQILLLVTTLVARLAKQFAVLLLGHALTALLDD